jgi:creatinine amidohydrolase/Fe(II)-dependent formamide hydrolase-like protein
MLLHNLPYDKLEELLPYIDTLILPIGSLTIPKQAADPIGKDLQLVRRVATGVEQQLTGRVFLLPEVIHTNFELPEQFGMAVEILGKYLYESLLSFKQPGFEKIVLLYGNEELSAVIEQTSSKLLEAGLRVMVQPIVWQEGSNETDFDMNVQQIVQNIIDFWQS